MAKRKIIEIDEDKCTGCGACVTKCAEGALQIVDGKAKVVNEVFCDGLGACIGECPEGALKIIEREAPEFDEEAVKRHMDDDSSEHASASGESPACGCPGHVPISLKGHANAGRPAALHADLPPELVNWPIQWKLVTPSMSFFKDQEVLIAADCVPFALRDFHGKYLAGRPVIIGCPKLDDQKAYLAKLTDIVKDSGLKSIQIVHMEVPCCFGIEKIVEEAVSRSGRKIPVRIAVVGVEGQVLRDA